MKQGRRDASYWNTEALRRVEEVLIERVACNLAELEASISDLGGPARGEPEPSHVQHAVRVMESKERIQAYRLSVGEFYVLSDGRGPQTELAAEVVERKARAYRSYLRLAEPGQASSQAAKNLVRLALRCGPEDSLQGRQGALTEIWEDSTDGDFLVSVQEGGIPLRVRVLNTRPWVFPDSPALLRFLAVCIERRELPVLVFRRATFSTFALFRQLGVLGYATRREFFDVSVSAALEQVIDVLGFRDVTVEHAPNKADRRFFGEVLPNNASSFLERFSACASGLRDSVVGGIVPFQELETVLERVGVRPRQAHARHDNVQPFGGSHLGTDDEDIPF